MSRDLRNSVFNNQIIQKEEMKRRIKKILFITGSPPYPTEVGGNQRTFLLMEALRRHYDIDLVTLRNPQTIDESFLKSKSHDFSFLGNVQPSPFSDRTVLRRLRHFNPELVDRASFHLLQSNSSLGVDRRARNDLRKLIDDRKYEFIVSRHIKPAALLDAFSIAPVIVDVDDREAEMWRNMAQKGGSGFLKRLSAGIRSRGFERNEPKILNKCAGAWFVKKEDVPIGYTRAHNILPNIAFSSSEKFDVSASNSIKESSGKTILGIGSFSHGPNIHGFNHFFESIWGGVLEQEPTAKFVLVGRGITSELAERWRGIDRLQLIGEVKDLSGYYDAATIAVAPIFLGAGSNIKVIESLYFGRCCVVSQKAARGFEGLPGLFKADSDQDFINLCVRLLTDEKFRRSSETCGRNVAASRFSYRTFCSSVDELLLKCRAK